MSIWLNSCNIKKFPKLEQNLNCDVAIIGGGITGISTAYYLCRKGYNVAILEKDLFAHKTTGNTTGKVTSQHNLFYDYLYKTFGLGFAKDYFEANELAINNIENIIKENDINCDFERKNSYVFTTDNKYVKKFEDEFKALKHINPNATYEHTVNIGLDTILGIKFPNQAQFNSIKYINGLLSVLEDNNVHLFENSKVTDVSSKENGYVVSTNLAKVNCKYAVITTRYPFINFPGFHFLKMYQSTDFAIAVETDMPILEDMYISFETPTISLRNYNYNNKKIAIIAGFDYKTGTQTNSEDGFLFLEQTAKRIYPDYKIISKWSSEDCISVDKLPYIGEFSTFKPNLYLATGFKKWGMTTSNIAANIICDSICGKENKYSYLFNSKRFNPIKNYKETGNMLKESVNSLVFNKFKVKEFDIDNIPKNSGRVLKYNGKIIGVYKDENEKIYAVKPICSHLGCLLTWNNVLKTWDCPCHGSRFDFMGNCIYGPSNEGLRTIEPLLK